MQLSHGIPTLAKIEFHVGNGRPLKLQVHIMPAMRHLAIAPQAQQILHNMTLRVPAIIFSIALAHHIDAADKGIFSIYDHRLLMKRDDRLDEYTHMSAIKQSADAD